MWIDRGFRLLRAVGALKLGHAWPRGALSALALLSALLVGSAAWAQNAPPAADALPDIERPLVQLGTGDTVTIQVYGQPDLGATVYVSDDGTMPVALIGAVEVAGLSPSEAAKRIEKALRDGDFVNDPHVTLTVTQSRSQRVSVLGEVGTPGRYAIDSRTSIFDLLAQAGGTRETSATTIYLMRTNGDGSVAQRYAIDLKGLNDSKTPLAWHNLQGGDVVFVPKSEQFYIYGEVASPNMYRIEPNMTVVQAIARAGGVTARGSTRRVEVKRHDSKGREVTSSIGLNDPVQPNDVIRVKESIF